jgi:hypothetical protein
MFGAGLERDSTMWGEEFVFTVLLVCLQNTLLELHSDKECELQENTNTAMFKRFI